VTLIIQKIRPEKKKNGERKIEGMGFVDENIQKHKNQRRGPIKPGRRKTGKKIVKIVEGGWERCHEGRKGQS